MLLRAQLTRHGLAARRSEGLASNADAVDDELRDRSGCGLWSACPRRVTSSLTILG